MSQKTANKGDGNQFVQFGGDLNGTLNQINGTQTLGSLTLSELADEYLLATSIVSRERRVRARKCIVAALACIACCGISVAAYWLLGKPSSHDLGMSLAGLIVKQEFSMNLTLFLFPLGSVMSGMAAYGQIAYPSELERDRRGHRRNAYMVARQRGLTERSGMKSLNRQKPARSGKEREEKDPPGGSVGHARARAQPAHPAPPQAPPTPRRIVRVRADSRR